jgi:hypothetical protein
MDLLYSADPFPHIIVPKLIGDDAYQRLRFPEIEPRPGGRIGRDIYRGEPGWDAITAEPGWRELAQRFRDPAFVARVLGLFANDIKQLGCGVDPGRARVETFCESRAETETAVLSETHDPNALFVRFDLQAADVTYDKGPHVDWPRRIVGGVLFLCDAAEEEIEGGEFTLYADEDFRNDRICHRPRAAAAFPIRHNFGVLFLNANGAFHGPQPIRAIRGLRKWVYYSISSRRNVWTAAPRALTPAA